MITLAAGLCLALVGLGAGWSYLRGRDRLDGIVALVFAPSVVYFLVLIPSYVSGRTGQWVGAVLALSAMAQPFLLLLLANVVHRVPTLLLRTAGLAGLAVAMVMALGPRPPALPTILVYVCVYVLIMLSVVYHFAAGARAHHASPSETRLWLATVATALLAAAVLVVGALGTVVAAIVADAIQIMFALAFIAAFLPPVWLRRVWVASAWNTVNNRLLATPADATPQQIWHRYGEVVRAVVAADAVVVLIRGDDGALRSPAADGVGLDLPPGVGDDDVEELLLARQPLPLRGPAAPASKLRAHYAARTPSRLLTALPLAMPPSGRGVLLILSRYRSLFAADDLSVLTKLGGQAGVLAERSATIAEQARLAGELATTVNQLQKASRAKSTFLANMSHELRTPLNAVIGFSELMRAEPSIDGQRTAHPDWADHIHTSGRHLLGLINDVLDLTKVEAGGLDLRPVPMRLDIAAAELLTSLQPLIGGKRLTAESEMPPLTADVDPVRFRQMLQNLLSNAIKFTPDGGTVTIVGVADGDSVAVTVNDTGIGIAEVDQERIFEEFQQSGDVNQRKSGTGLGLSLTRRLAQAHGGNVTVRSMPGRGSTFTIHLPARSPAAAPRSDAGPGDQRAGRVDRRESESESESAAVPAAGADVRPGGHRERIDAGRQS